MKRHLVSSLLIHLLIFGSLLISFKESVPERIIQEITIIPRKESGGKGSSKTGGLFGKKSAYEISKSTQGKLPALSDEAEIKKELADEEGRPAYMKKDVLYKNYYDMTGERAVIPWFNEVEKIAKIKKFINDRTFITTVIIVLNSKGEVVKVVLVSSSGDTLMDLAVKNAFLGQEYGPPPKSLIDPDGFARLKWIFEMHLDFDMRRNKGQIKIYRIDNQ